MMKRDKYHFRLHRRSREEGPEGLLSSLSPAFPRGQVVLRVSLLGESADCAYQCLDGAYNLSTARHGPSSPLHPEEIIYPRAFDVLEG